MMAIALSAALMCIGLYGVLTRRDIVAVLASVEVMLAGPLLLMLVLSSRTGATHAVTGVGLMLLVVMAAEAAVGLSLLVSVARRRGTTRIDELREVRG